MKSDVSLSEQSAGLLSFLFACSQGGLVGERGVVTLLGKTCCAFSILYSSFCSFLLCLVWICEVERRLVLSVVGLGRCLPGLVCLLPVLGEGPRPEGKLLGDEGAVSAQAPVKEKCKSFCKHAFVFLWGPRLKTANDWKFSFAVCVGAAGYGEEPLPVCTGADSGLLPEFCSPSS